MPVVSSTSSKKVLIIEDMFEVSKNLQMSLSSLGFNKLHTAFNAKNALEKMSQTEYDIILCDYNLGEGPNGQQLLEYLRHEERIPKSALFIIFTAENSYKTVVSTAEFQPDDYMLKPFTAATFMKRLERLNIHHNEMAKVNKALSGGSMTDVVTEADKVINLKDKNYFEAIKVKGIALLSLGDYKACHDLYERVVSIRPLPWALLGLAKCKFHLGDLESAKAICMKNINENPHHLQTVDFMSGLLLSNDEHDEAERILKRASEIAPNNLGRARVMGSIFMSKGNFEDAEISIADAIRNQKHSLVKSALDYSMLAKSMTAQNKTDDAINTLNTAKKQFTDSGSSALLAATASMAYLKAGEHEKAEEEIRLAMMTGVDEVSAEAATVLAEAFFVNGYDEHAQKFIASLVEMDPDNLLIKSHVKLACASAARVKEIKIDNPVVNGLVGDLISDIVRINKENSRSSRSRGRFDDDYV